MIFNTDNIAISILDVFEFQQQNVHSHTTNRKFHAISFRIYSDSNLFFGNNHISASSGSVTYVPANTSYTRICRNEKLIVIHFELFNYSSNDIQVIMPKDYDRFKKDFEHILNLWNRREIGYKHHCCSMLYEILAILQKETVNTQKCTNIPPEIAKAKDYINKHYTEKYLYISELAEMSYMSEVYFRKLFKKAYSISPKKYIINLRIEQSISLLNSGYFSISEIAERIWNCDSKYFSTVFKKATGVSPSNYNYKDFTIEGISLRTPV